MRRNRLHPKQYAGSRAANPPRRLTRFHLILLGVVICLAGLPAAAADNETESAQDEAAQGDQEREGFRRWVSGEFTNELDGQWAGKYNDVDLDQTLRINIDPPELPRLHLRSSFWFHEDLDSHSDSGNVLNGINDSYSSDTTARILRLYLDIDDLWGDSTLRIGRQRLFETPSVTRIDGVYFKKRQPRWDWYAFGGVRASLYEESHNDPIFGGGASVRITSKTRAALDASYSEVDRRNREPYRRQFRFSGWRNPLYNRSEDHRLNDTRIALSVWQEITPNLRLFARYDWYETDSDEALLQVTGFIPAWGTVYEITYRRLIDTSRDRVSHDTSFYRVMGDYEEYDDLLLAVHQPLTEKFSLSLEAQFHDVDHKGWEGPNRDFQRYAATLDGTGLCWGLDASLTAEYWDVDDQDGSWSVSGDVTKTWGAVEATLSAGYERYTHSYDAYDPLPNLKNQFRNMLNPGAFTANNFMVNLQDDVTVNVNEDIYWLEAKCTWAFRKNQEVDLGITYELDDTSESPYWRVRTGYRLKF